MANWWTTARTTPNLTRRSPAPKGRSDENLRSFRACPAQPPRVIVAQFSDYDWHLGRRGLAGCNALAWHRLAEISHAASGQVRSVRYRGRNLAPRDARL